MEMSEKEEDSRDREETARMEKQNSQLSEMKESNAASMRVHLALLLSFSFALFLSMLLTVSLSLSSPLPLCFTCSLSDECSLRCVSVSCPRYLCWCTREGVAAHRVSSTHRERAERINWTGEEEVEVTADERRSVVASTLSPTSALTLTLHSLGS